MNQNPYAAPHAPGPETAIQGVPLGPQEPWEVGEVVNAALQTLLRDWVVLVFAPVITGIIGLALIEAAGWAVRALGIVDASPPPPTDFNDLSLLLPRILASLTVMGLVYPVALAVQSFFKVGLTRIYLAAARGKPPTMGMLFSGASRFPAMLATTVLMAIVVILGYCFFIVPGVILSIGLYYAPYFVADTNLGPIDSLYASWRVTAGQKGKLCVMGLVAFVIALASIVTCGLGFLVGIPVLGVASSIIYLRITGQSRPVAFGALPPGYGYNAPPQDGYGPPTG